MIFFWQDLPQNQKIKIVLNPHTFTRSPIRLKYSLAALLATRLT